MDDDDETYGISTVLNLRHHKVIHWPVLLDGAKDYTHLSPHVILRWFNSLRGRAHSFDKQNHLTLAQVKCLIAPSPLNRLIMVMVLM